MKNNQIASKQQKFTFHPVFWQIFSKTTVTVTRRDVCVKTPRQVLGIIPTATTAKTIPSRNIASVSLHQRIKFAQFLIGLLAAFGGFALTGMGSFEEAFIAPVMIIAGLCMTLSSIRKALVIGTAAGDVVIAGPWYANGTLRKIEAAISESLNYEADKGDLFLFEQRNHSMLRKLA